VRRRSTSGLVTRPSAAMPCGRGRFAAILMHPEAAQHRSPLRRGLIVTGGVGCVQSRSSGPAFAGLAMLTRDGFQLRDRPRYRGVQSSFRPS
jgi:hypothetical protein